MVEQRSGATGGRPVRWLVAGALAAGGWYASRVVRGAYLVGGGPRHRA